METKMKVGTKLVAGNLLVSPEGDVLLYAADMTLLHPGLYNGTPEDFIKEVGHDASTWTAVRTSNPYGSYEENCFLHSVGAINMDDPYTW